MSLITLHSTIKRKDHHLLSSELGSELVMMDMENGNYIGLNIVARIIWEEIASAVRVDELVDRLLSRFKVERTQCIQETLECLETFYRQQLLTVE